jgi:hypothetical protein
MLNLLFFEQHNLIQRKRRRGKPASKQAFLKCKKYCGNGLAVNEKI